jgi:hypothetical protein
VSAPVEAAPVVGSDPLQAPDAVHDVALVELQLSLDVLPLVRPVGEAVKVTVGAAGPAATATVAVAAACPPAPEQVSV